MGPLLYTLSPEKKCACLFLPTSICNRLSANRHPRGLVDARQMEVDSVNPKSSNQQKKLPVFLPVAQVLVNEESPVYLQPEGLGVRGCSLPGAQTGPLVKNQALGKRHWDMAPGYLVTKVSPRPGAQ